MDTAVLNKRPQTLACSARAGCKRIIRFGINENIKQTAQTLRRSPKPSVLPGQGSVRDEG
jgi:hypothetical protein